MSPLTFEEKVRKAGYKPDFALFDRLSTGEFYRFGPSKSHWMVKNQNGSVTCGDWFERLPRVTHGVSTKKFEYLNPGAYKSPLESSYLARKGVLEMQKKLSGVMVAADHLCIPVYDINGILLSYQKIYDDGRKKFFTGYTIKGGHYVIGELKNLDRIIFCEGLATGCSLFLSTKYPIIITFGISNLGRVVDNYRKLFPNSSLLVASDKGNCEKTSYDVASQYECHIAIPDFKDFPIGPKDNDFNDLHMRSSLAEVKQQVEEAFNKLPEQQNIPVILLEDCFDESDGVHKKYRIKFRGDFKEIWIKGTDLKDYKNIEGILNGYNLFVDKKQMMHIISMMKAESPNQSSIMNNECGWRGEDFYLPSLDKPCVNPEYKPFIRKGNLIDFKKEIFPIAERNPLITFILSYAFLPLFLKDFGISNFGVHLFGGGSTGKTTLLKLAASIWGTTIEDWEGTYIGFGDLAYRNKDTLYCLDEINQMDEKDLYQIIYMLGNGGGRLRSQIKRNSKEVFDTRPPFRINYLSTGESKMQDKLKDKFTGGHLVRVLDINCHRSQNVLQGIFDHTEDSEKDILLLEGIYKTHQNVSIDHMIKNFKEAKSIFDGLSISNPHKGQLGRIKNSFIAIEKAGLTAKALGCIPDLPISKHVEKIFLNLEIKENSSHEIEVAKRRIYALLIEGEAFFYGGGQFERIPYKIKGYKKDGAFYLTPPTLKDEICDNINYKSTKEKLIKDNIIEDYKLYKVNNKVFQGYKVNQLWFEQYGEE